MTFPHRAVSTTLAIAFASTLAACGGEQAGSSEEQFAHESPLRYDSYEVLFTNPSCRDYPYDQEVRSNKGEVLTQKPKDVFCFQPNDNGPSGARETSPQYRLLQWIEDPSTTEIFFTYLSFSNSTVQKALCKAVEERDVKITFVLDSSSDTSKADLLTACQPASGDAARKPTLLKRGHTPGIGYAHNKLFMVNPGADSMKIAFSSGNMSSGVVTHHENWNFITLSSDTYFAQAHLCLMNAEINNAGSKSEYRSAIEACLDEISYPEETDIKAFFVPADRYKASDTLIDAVYAAWNIDIAAHRFTYSKLVKALKYDLDNWEMDVRLITDDDMYWAGKGEQVGDNMSFEYYNAKSLEDRGAQVRWMETNHGSHLLHHNKFLVFDMGPGGTDSVWCGAGNLTGTGFSTNWENFYYVTIPEVVDAYKAQYQHMWNDLATATEDMPSTNVLPPYEN